VTLPWQSEHLLPVVVQKTFVHVPPPFLLSPLSLSTRLLSLLLRGLAPPTSHMFGVTHTTHFILIGAYLNFTAAALLLTFCLQLGPSLTRCLCPRLQATKLTVAQAICPLTCTHPALLPQCMFPPPPSKSSKFLSARSLLLVPLHLLVLHMPLFLITVSQLHCRHCHLAAHALPVEGTYWGTMGKMM
jgi:hypothetical protein